MEKYILESKTLEELVFNLINELDIWIRRSYTGSEYEELEIDEELVLLRNKAKELLNA